MSRSLRTERMSVAFDGLRALSNVTFDIPPARINGLVGPNGASKTMLVNELTGFQVPIGGRAALDGVAKGAHQGAHSVITTRKIKFACANRKDETSAGCLMCSHCQGRPSMAGQSGENHATAKATVSALARACKGDLRWTAPCRYVLGQRPPQISRRFAQASRARLNSQPRQCLERGALDEPIPAS